MTNEEIYALVGRDPDTTEVQLKDIVPISDQFAVILWRGNCADLVYKSRYELSRYSDGEEEFCIIEGLYDDYILYENEKDIPLKEWMAYTILKRAWDGLGLDNF